MSDLKQAAALVLLGVAVGCAGSHFYFMGFVEDRADDGLPMAIGGEMYVVTAMNMSDVCFGSDVWMETRIEAENITTI